MSYKRVPLYYGDTVQLCFVPQYSNQTLAAYDDLCSRETSSMFIRTKSEGYPITLEADFLRSFPVFGDYHIGMLNGTRLVGHFKFEPLIGQNKVDPIFSKNEKLISQFSELRSGYWDIVFHSKLSIQEKRGFKSYFVSSDNAVVEHGGKSLLTKFNELWELLKTDNADTQSE